MCSAKRGALAGLVPPAAAVALLGKGGAVMIVLIILMAITCASSPTFHTAS